MSSLTVGLIKGASIWEDISDICKSDGCPEYVYVTCLDSGHGAEMVGYIEDFVATGVVPCQAMQEGLLFRSPDIDKILNEFGLLYGFNLFNGFDECRFLRSPLGAELPLNEETMTSEVALLESESVATAYIDVEKLRDFLPWAIAATCELCLGDGTGLGLNYIAFTLDAQNIMLELERSFLTELA